VAIVPDVFDCRLAKDGVPPDAANRIS